MFFFPIKFKFKNLNKCMRNMQDKTWISLKKKKEGTKVMQVDKGDYFLFGSIFIKKISKPEFFSFKKTETDSNWFDSIFSVWLDFFGLARFFRFGSVFSGLAWFFQFGSVLARFFSGFYRFGFDLVFSVSGL